MCGCEAFFKEGVWQETRVTLLYTRHRGAPCQWMARVFVNQFQMFLVSLKNNLALLLFEAQIRICNTFSVMLLWLLGLLSCVLQVKTLLQKLLYQTSYEPNDSDFIATHRAYCELNIGPFSSSYLGSQSLHSLPLDVAPLNPNPGTAVHLTPPVHSK